MREDRRRLLFGAAALFAAPLIAFGKPAQRARRIGFLSPDVSDSAIGLSTQRDFVAALRRLGYKEGSNLLIEWRWGNGKVETLPALAEDLVRRRVELIVARTNEPIAAAKRATQTIPIVMFNGNYPVEVGFVESLSRPGGNVTGTSYSSPGIAEKQIELLKEVAPKAVRVAILLDSRESNNSAYGKTRGDAFERAAARTGMKLQYFEVSPSAGVKSALDRIAASRPDALWCSGTPSLREHLGEIATFAVKQRLVSVGAVPLFVDTGGLLSYAPGSEYYDRTASYVDRILKGAHPPDLPVEEPTRFSLLINLKTARALGIKIPASLLARAERVID